MQIILLDKVVNLGALGDIVKVKDGYARNFLIPSGRARRATEANKAEFAAKRAELKAILISPNTTDEEFHATQKKLQKLPRNANPTRQRNRCEMTGRPRGTFRQFGLARAKIRELAFSGDIPGVTKASW